MMEFLAANFNLPTIIVAVIVFGGVGLDRMALPQAWRRLQWVQRLRRRRLQWQLQRLQRLSLSIETIRKGRGLEHSARALFRNKKLALDNIGKSIRKESDRHGTDVGTSALSAGDL